MNQLSALIVDDEEDGRKTLKRFLEKYCPDVSVVAEAASVDEADRQIKSHHPRLVFLDISMPDESGFGLFSRISAPDFYTIFVTAHDEYALRAIKHHALDYLLKPVNIDELIAAVERAKSLSGTDTVTRQISGLLQMMQRSRLPEKIALPILDGFMYKDVKEIIRCEAEGNYTCFYFTNSLKLVVCRTLGIYETILGPYGFVRVHHHHLINTMHVEKYQRGRGGMILMSDKAEVIVSQRKKDEFLRMIDLTATEAQHLKDIE